MSLMNHVGITAAVVFDFSLVMIKTGFLHMQNQRHRSAVQ